jgi:hypothetical protein
MNVVGCPQAPGLIDKNNREAGCNAPLQCSAFTDPCSSVTCPDNSRCKPEDRSLTPDYCCYVCPMTCATQTCPPKPVCQRPLELRRTVDATDPMGCCEHCRDVCNTHPCKGIEPNDEICGLMGDPEAKKWRFVKDPAECCGKCIDPCLTEKCADATAPRTEADCPPLHKLVPQRDNCCKKCRHICDRVNQFTFLPEPCPPLTCEPGTTAEIPTRADENSCCATKCIAPPAPRSVMDQEMGINWILYGSIGGAAGCCLLLLLLILIVCCVVQRRKKNRDVVIDANPLYSNHTMMRPIAAPSASTQDIAQQPYTFQTASFGGTVGGTVGGTTRSLPPTPPPGAHNPYGTGTWQPQQQQAPWQQQQQPMHPPPAAPWQQQHHQHQHHQHQHHQPQQPFY